MFFVICHKAGKLKQRPLEAGREALFSPLGVGMRGIVSLVRNIMTTTGVNTPVSNRLNSECLSISASA